LTPAAASLAAKKQNRAPSPDRSAESSGNATPRKASGGIGIPLSQHQRLHMASTPKIRGNFRHRRDNFDGNIDRQKPAEKEGPSTPGRRRRRLSAFQTMVYLNAHELALLRRGLLWIGFKRIDRISFKTQVQRFRSVFGEGPKVISILFEKMKSKSSKFKEKYGFMACNWLVTYATETDLAGEYSFNQSVPLVLAFLQIFFTYLQDDMIAASTLLNGRQRNT